MVGEEEESAANSSKKVLCEECRKNPSKYKCPACSTHTCCLSCVKAHKERTSCTGKKHYNDVVPLSQFDDNLLLSDYNMLEEVKRVAESGRRMRFKISTNFRLPFPLKSLRSAAASRRTKLLFFSNGMSKREKNRTYYNNSKKYISWTIEWHFHSTGIVLMDHGIHENRSLFSVIENHLKPGPWKNQLRQFCEQPLDSLKFFIRKYPKGQRSPYRELNLSAPIREQLSNLVILEYPVIHVFLPCHSYDFEVIKDANPCRVEDRNKESVKSEELCQPGVYFREEEIEEDGDSPDPRESYAMNTSKADKEFKNSAEKTGSDETLNDGFDSKVLDRTNQSSASDLAADARKSKVGCGNEGCKSEEMAIYGDIEEFDFNQGSADAYRDIMTETGDVFLDFTEVLPDGFLEGGKGDADLATIDEELEEGEIV